MSPLMTPEKEIFDDRSGEQVVPVTINGYKIEVELLPQKKGLLIKHVAYLVSSEKHQSQVERRYSDFMAMHELILSRYPYRLIPRLPPQKLAAIVVGVNSDLVGQRRRALKRWLSILIAHPITSMDPIMQDFFSYTGVDCATHLKTQYRAVPDEFITGSIGNEGHHEGSTESTTARDVVERIHTSISKIIVTAERHIERAQKIGEDMTIIANECDSLSKEWSTESFPMPSNSQSNRSIIAKALQQTSEGLVHLSILWPNYANGYDINILEILKLIQDVLVAHKDLCERAEKNMVTDHKKGIEKISNIKKRKFHGVLATDANLLEATENRINAMEGILQDLESRQRFSNASIIKENEIVFRYTDLIADAVSELSKTELSAGESFIGVWKIVHHNITYNRTS